MDIEAEAPNLLDLAQPELPQRRFSLPPPAVDDTGGLLAVCSQRGNDGAVVRRRPGAEFAHIRVSCVDPGGLGVVQLRGGRLVVDEKGGPSAHAGWKLFPEEKQVELLD